MHTPLTTCVCPRIKLKINEMDLPANQNEKIWLQSAPAEHNYQISSAPGCTTSSNKEKKFKISLQIANGCKTFNFPFFLHRMHKNSLEIQTTLQNQYDTKETSIKCCTAKYIKSAARRRHWHDSSQRWRFRVKRRNPIKQLTGESRSSIP